MEITTMLDTMDQINQLLNHIYLHKHLIPQQLIALLSEFGPFWRGVFGIPSPITTTPENRADDQGEPWDLTMPTQPRMIKGGFKGVIRPQSEVEILPVTTPAK